MGLTDRFRANEIAHMHDAFKRAGFRAENTGGGCQCFRKDLDGEAWIVTLYEDPVLPARFTDEIGIGIYPRENWEECGGSKPRLQVTRTVRAFLDQLASGTF
jgi:hypothetical protein